MNQAQIFVGDSLEKLRELQAGSVRTCVTSPPYWGLRDYGNDGQLGLEATPQEFIENLCQVFDEVRRVLADDGTLWVNLGDSYLEKSLAGVPWRFAFAMQDRGWYLRQDIIWAKPNPMPESVTDRCTKSHEYVFLLTKSPRYYYDNVAVKEDATSKGRGTQNVGAKNKLMPSQLGGQSGLSYAKARNPEEGRNRRSVWTITTKPFKGAHFAVMPESLVEPCVLAGSAAGDTVLDPFSGSGTTGVVALKNGRNYIGVELNPDYAEMSRKRIQESIGMFGEVV